MEQHFLVNEEKIQRVLSHAAIAPHEHVVELGSWEGSMEFTPVASLLSTDFEPFQPFSSTVVLVQEKGRP